MIIAASDAPRASRAMPRTVPSLRVARDDAEDSFGITVRGSRFVFTGSAEASSAETATLPRSPLALSAGVLEILAALTSPSLARRQG